MRPVVLALGFALAGCTLFEDNGTHLAYDLERGATQLRESNATELVVRYVPLGNDDEQPYYVEMTRKRTRESLAHVLCEPCPVCQGRGELKTAQTICYEILRSERQFSAKEYRILASQKVIDLFLDEEADSLTQLGDFIGKPISMQVETAYMQEQYDVILV